MICGAFIWKVFLFSSIHKRRQWRHRSVLIYVLSACPRQCDKTSRRRRWKIAFFFSMPGIFKLINYTIFGKHLLLFIRLWALASTTRRGRIYMFRFHGIIHKQTLARMLPPIIESIFLGQTNLIYPIYSRQSHHRSLWELFSKKKFIEPCVDFLLCLFVAVFVVVCFILHME